MFSAGTLFTISASLFGVVALITQMEQARGRRFFLSKFRDWCDRVFAIIYDSVSNWLQRVLRHTIKLSWYYSIHSMLKALLTVLVRLYDRLELVFVNNRERTKVLRAEKRSSLTPKNHLTVISEHKASSALTPGQKKKLRAKKLAGE